MKKVLVVEDHADIRRLIRMTLEFEACEVHEANNGVRGWAEAQTLRPDVILLDVMMPGELDGLDVCRRVKAEPALAHTRVVMLSARGTAADVERGQQAGADAYMIKPFSPLQLIRVIDDVSTLAG